MLSTGTAQRNYIVIGTILAVLAVPSIVLGADIITQTTEDANAPFGLNPADAAKVGQSFTHTTGIDVTAIQLKVGKNASPADNIRCGIQADSSGSPSGTYLGSNTITGSTLSTTPGSVQTFTLSLSLTANTTYWVVCDRDGALNDTNYYLWRKTTTDPYSGGFEKYYESATWTSVTGSDMYFIIQGSETSSGSTATSTGATANDYYLGVILISITAILGLDLLRRIFISIT